MRTEAGPEAPEALNPNAVLPRPADVMKNVNRIQYGDLTEEQIAAARQRRSFEMCAPRCPSTVTVTCNSDMPRCVIAGA